MISGSEAQAASGNATGKPTVTGTAQVGQTLTADTSGISDPDGMTGVSFSYQWIWVTGNREIGLGGFTQSTYTILNVDRGSKFKVRVSFTDNSGSQESIVSDATATITNPPANAPTWTKPSPGEQIVVAENSTGTIYTYQATDADGDTVTYSISGGADSAKFSINSTSGALSFKTAPDFETPTDANGISNNYEIVVRATSGTGSGQKFVEVGNTVVVTDAPSFPSSGRIAFSAAENQTAVGTVSVPGATAYAIESGADGSKFSINSTSGVLTFKTAPDYETPTDVRVQNDLSTNEAGNNQYVAIIKATATSGGVSESSLGAVTVTVTNVTGEPGEAATAPDPVANISVTHNGNSLTVSWPASRGATSYDVTYYNVNTGLNARAAWGHGKTSLVITCDVRADLKGQYCVNPGDTYTVGVRAKNSAGASAWRNSLRATRAGGPPPVTGISVTHNGTSLSVSWTAPARATQYDVTYYNVGTNTNARAAWNRAGTTLTITCDIRTAFQNQNCITETGSYTVGVRAKDASKRPSAWRNSGQINAPARLSVANASVNEPSAGNTATLDFVVTLNRNGATGQVTVDYATADGTATAGSDYTSKSGTLTFATNETSKTVSVTVLSDAINDAGETLTFTLSNPRGAIISSGKGVGTGTINNDGHIPQAWISRFGRTVAHQVLDAVETRMHSAPAPGSEMMLAGIRVSGGPQQTTGRSLAVVSGDNLLASSSFALTPEAGAGDLTWSLWGRGAVTSFDGRDGELSLDGNVTTALLGADWTWGYGSMPDGEVSGNGRWRAGLLVSHSTGDGGYGEADGGSAPGMSGKVKAHLTGFFPWVRRALNDQLAAWGVVGYGQGEVTVTPKDAVPLSASLNLWTAAGGLRGTLMDGGSDGLTLTSKTDVMVVGTSSGQVTGDGGKLASSQATVTRLRLGLEASRPVQLGSGATLTPSLEAGLRHDGGDAETGFGLALGGGLALSHPEGGLEAALRGHALLTHAADDFRDRGFSGSLSWRQKPDSDRGMALSLTQTVGGVSFGSADALLNRTTLEGLVANGDGGNDDLKNQRLEFKLGYGLPAFGDRFTLTPELGLGFYDSGRDYRIGWSLTRPDAVESFALSFDATRRERNNNGAAPEHGIKFGLNTQF